MKNIYKISLIILIFASFKINAQLDTLNYVKQFETNKSLYIGQPFSTLLNDMILIQPKTIWSMPSFKSKNFNYRTTLNFSDKEYSFGNTITLSITWENPIPRNDTKYLEQLNHFYFTNDERNFYGNKIVKDIKVYR